LYIYVVKIYLYIVLLFIAANLQAQNLVQNGGFEDIDTCPDQYGQIDKAFHWDSPNYKYYTSSIIVGCELFHTCAPNSINIPDSYWGGGYAPEGNSYVGGYFLHYMIDTLRIKEYMQNELLNPLKPNIWYCFKMKITLGNPSQKAINDISVYFSPTKTADSTSLVLSYLNPQITNTSGQYYNNKSGWDEYTGYFKADGGEKFMIIGSFLPTDSTPRIGTLGSVNAAYYMIDDVQLVECGDSLNTEINENNINNKIKLYPNPTTGILTVEIKGEVNKARLELYDAIGNMFNVKPKWTELG